MEALLKQLNKKDALCFFSLLNMLVANDGYSNINLQVGLRKLFFPLDVISKIIEIWDENKRIIIFTELQITNIIKLLVLFSGGGGITIDKIEKTPQLSDIFLIMNDLITNRHEEKAQKSDTRKEIIDSFLKTMMSSHTYANREKIEFAIPRYYILFFDILQLTEIQEHKLYLDFHKIFFYATGLHLKTYVV